MSVLARALKWQEFRAYAAPVEETKYYPSWTVISGPDNLWSDLSRGGIWQAPQSFKLSAIEVPLGRYSGWPQCENGIMELYHNPQCGVSPGTLIASVTKALGTLPATPNYAWIKFDFDPVVVITGGETYCHLLVGCVTWATQKIFRLHRGDPLSDGVSICWVQWDETGSPPVFTCDEAYDSPFYLYKQRLI